MPVLELNMKGIVQHVHFCSMRSLLDHMYMVLRNLQVICQKAVTYCLKALYISTRHVWERQQQERVG